MPLLHSASHSDGSPSAVTKLAKTQLQWCMQQFRCARTFAQAACHARIEGGNLPPGQSVRQWGSLPEAQPERSQQPAGLLTAHHDALLDAGQASCCIVLNSIFSCIFFSSIFSSTIFGSSTFSSTHTQKEGSDAFVAMCLGLWAHICKPFHACMCHRNCAIVCAIAQHGAIAACTGKAWSACYLRVRQSSSMPDSNQTLVSCVSFQPYF